MLIELRSNYLPWGKSTREDRILHLKESISDKQLLSNGKMEFYEEILAHLRKLRYPDRPDYRYMYKLVMLYDRFLIIITILIKSDIILKFNIKCNSYFHLKFNIWSGNILQMVSPMIRKRYLFNEPYDWEVVSVSETQEESESLKSSSKSISANNAKCDFWPFNLCQILYARTFKLKGNCLVPYGMKK